MTTDRSSPPHLMVFSHAPGPIDEPMTKLGGQPVWLQEPAWPVCFRHETPMGFIGQFRLPGRRVRVAYLFMSAHHEGTWDAEGGENALIVQPGRVPSFVETIPRRTGESLVHEELFVDLEEVNQTDVSTRDSWLLGAPIWQQYEEVPPGGPWTFFFQLRASVENHYDLNFGDAGVGYAFLSGDLAEGRFLWQG
ncbi:hypothetical protein ACWEN6_16620 [Sphaerisporangium sp. NPDC004334]